MKPAVRWACIATAIAEISGNRIMRAAGKRAAKNIHLPLRATG
jgi:hypothetical protein